MSLSSDEMSSRNALYSLVVFGGRLVYEIFKNLYVVSDLTQKIEYNLKIQTWYLF